MYSLGMLSNRKKYIFWAAAIGLLALSLEVMLVLYLWMPLGVWLDWYRREAR